MEPASYLTETANADLPRDMKMRWGVEAVPVTTLPERGKKAQGRLADLRGQFARYRETAILRCKCVFRWRSINYGH